MTGGNLIRADRLLFQQGWVESRQKAGCLIMSGVVFTRSTRVGKPSQMLSRDAELTVKKTLPYVSRGGLKLEGALKAFNINVEGVVAVDIGASTGGFTDCLLKHGASEIYAIDVGYGQLDWFLRNDTRVKVFERTNIRYFNHNILDTLTDIVVIDVSFISLKKVIPVAKKMLKKGGIMLPLVKPQFEATRAEVGKGGIVKDTKVHDRVLHDLSQFVEDEGFTVLDIISSPIKGAKGDREFFMYTRI